MSVYLRIILFVVSLASNLYVIRKIRKSQMKIESAMYWVFFSALILLLSIFPGIGITLANWIGIESPVNLIFLVMIFIVLGKLFSLSVKSSQLEYKISILTEEIAIWRKQLEDGRYKEDNVSCNEKDKE